MDLSVVFATLVLESLSRNALYFEKILHKVVKPINKTCVG